MHKLINGFKSTTLKPSPADSRGGFIALSAPNFMHIARLYFKASGN